MSLELAAEKVNAYRERPSLMVEDLFGDALRAMGSEIDLWQRDVLDDFPRNPRQVMACCKGPGKTTVLAWLGWHFLLTRRFPKVGVLSVTAKNLQDNLWTELAKWRAASPLLMGLFEMTSERIFLKAAPETWFMTARSFRQSATVEELGNALAGLWAEHVLFLIDEAGGVPVPILRTAEAALQREGTEGHLVLAGNTTQTDGSLYEAVVTRRPMWKCYEVTADPDDPKRTPRISLQYAREQIAEFGRDDPFVMINILAKFPSQGVDQLISADSIRECMGRHLHANAYEWAPKIIGVDVADKGDDRTVIWKRQGPAYIGAPLVLRNLDTVFVAGHVGQLASQWGADSIQVDASGGYGVGVIAILHQEHYSAMGVYGSGKPLDPQFYNKRTECYWLAAKHMKEGASLPAQGAEELVHELSAIRYGYKGDKLLIEPKEEIRARLGRSPDLADGLVYTHAFPVAVTRDTRAALFPFDMGGSVSKSKTDYDPLTRP